MEGKVSECLLLVISVELAATSGGQFEFAEVAEF